LVIRFECDSESIMEVQHHRLSRNLFFRSTITVHSVNEQSYELFQYSPSWIYSFHYKILHLRLTRQNHWKENSSANLSFSNASSVFTVPTFVLYTTLFVIHGGSVFETEAFEFVIVICWWADIKQRRVGVLISVIRYSSSKQTIYCGKCLGRQYHLFLFPFCECIGRAQTAWKIELRSAVSGCCLKDGQMRRWQEPYISGPVYRVLYQE